MDLYLQNNNYQTINQISPTIYKSKIVNLLPDNYQNSTIDNSYNNNHIFNMSNTYHNLGQKKFVFSNPNNNKKSQLNDSINLNFRILESTTEDEEHPLRELKKGLKGRGWQSSRFSQFPQDIYIQFFQPVLIKRIDIITHEKKIPCQIKFFSYCPKNNDEIVKNYHQVNYDYIGFIKMDTNERFNYLTRESRKIYVNSKSLFLKIQLDKNYINQYNIFNQVGLMNVDFLGEYLPFLGGKNRNNNLILENALRLENIKDEDLTNICGDKLEKLKDLMEKNIKTENYEECKELKSKIDKIRLYGKKIFDLESQKKIAVNNEDFDKAMELRDLVEKMKNNIKYIDNNSNNNIKYNNTMANLIDFDNKIIPNNNNLNNISLVPMATNNNTINDSGLINESINDNLMAQFEQSNSNYTNNNNVKSLFSNKFNNINHLNNNNNNNTKENFINHDDMVLPAVLKRINNEPENKQDEFGSTDKGELEPIYSKILKDFYLITKIIKEEGMKKIFSKQVLWKEEGLSILLENIVNLLEYKEEENNSNTINITISQIMKLSLILIEDKHPSIIIKTLQVLKQLFEYLKEHNFKLNIEPNITDSILFKIKQKIGDVNPKVRAKAVDLYSFMLTLNFCDYNNLISELLEEELKHYDSKYIPKSNNLIMGKLDIFISVFNNFSDAIKSKRTKIETFPYNLVIEYLLMNVSHNKSEIRKKTRFVISQFIRYFGALKIKKKLEKIEERELMKLVAEIPELREYFPKLYSPSNCDLSNGNELNLGINGRRGSKANLKINNLYNYGEDNEKKNSSKNKNLTKKKSVIKKMENNFNDNTKSKDDEKKNENIENNNIEGDKKENDKNIKNDFCEYCKNKLKNGEILANHWITNCKMFTQCEKCFMNLEVQKLNEHRGKECKFKEQYKLCKNCNENFLKEEYNKHVKEKCSIKIGYIKCPLCHKDIDAANKKGFYLHLIKQGCPQQNRNKKM